MADLSRGQARRAALLRHPLLTILSALRHKRGVTREGAEAASADAILRRVAELPLSVWTYGFDHASVRHLGPMAQDFAAAFGLGSSDRRIDMVDANGVALASIQALYRRVVALEQEVAQLRAGPVRDHDRVDAVGAGGDDRGRG